MKLVLLGLLLSSSLALAAENFRVKVCTYKAIDELDSHAMDVIKSNNFDQGIYTAARLNPELSEYSGQAGVGIFRLSTQGLGLMKISLCNESSQRKDISMDTADVSFDEEIKINDLITSKGAMKIPLDGAYLSSDEHVALSGSMLILEYVKDEGQTSVLKGTVRLVVANLTSDQNSGAEEGNLKADEILTGHFYLFAKGAKLLGTFKN